MRLTAIDGFRGIFLVFMMIIHANDILNTTLGKLNHHYFGWVEDAQGFVFMSGMVVGLVYGGRFIKYGFDTMRRDIWTRIKTIYSHHFFLIFLFTLITFTLSFGAASVPAVLHSYAAEPILFPVLSAFMVTGSAHMGILPMYIIFMVATPYALRLLNARRYITYGVIIAICWAFAQTRLPDAFVGGSEAFFEDAGYALNLGIFFNVLGWQALFFAGLFIGFLMASKRLDTSFIRTPEMRQVFLICVVLFFFFGVYDRIVFDNWISDEFSNAIKAEVDRGNLSTIYVITFAIDLLIVVWMLGPGVMDGNKIISIASRILTSVVTWRPFVFLGQHSLHVFSSHIIIVYIIFSFFDGARVSEPIGAVIIVLSLAILYMTAFLHVRFGSRRKNVSATKAAQNK